MMMIYLTGSVFNYLLILTIEYMLESRTLQALHVAESATKSLKHCKCGTKHCMLTKLKLWTLLTVLRHYVCT